VSNAKACKCWNQQKQDFAKAETGKRKTLFPFDAAYFLFVLPSS